MKNQSATLRKVLKRGCGYRVPGTYAVTKVHEEGAPIDYFGMCPPWEVDKKDIGLSERGIQLIEGTPYGRPGLWDMWDIVGKEPYPWVTDFWTEGKYMGFSRRVNEKMRFDKLSRQSRHFLLHSQASLINYIDFYDNRLGIKKCPQGHETHNDNSAASMCLGLLWEAIGYDPDMKERNIFTRHFPVDEPSFSYDVAKAPVEPEWQLAVFMWLPITQFEIVDDPLNKSAADTALEILGGSGTDIPFVVVDE